MTDYKYQNNFSAIHPQLYDMEQRTQKARKILAILGDYYHGQLDSLKVLDLGCSTGIMSHLLAPAFRQTIGVDIDQAAIDHANTHFASPKLRYDVQDAMNIRLPQASFDTIVCAQVYEHVPDARRLMDEIYRLLKPGGICYFAAGNRLIWMERHYNLPLLSAIPKPLAHHYIRLFRKADYYYETHHSLWGLRALVKRFEVIDYTSRIIAQPDKFNLQDMVQTGSLKQKMALAVLKWAYWACPTYIWLLRKPATPA